MVNKGGFNKALFEGGEGTLAGLDLDLEKTQDSRQKPTRCAISPQATFKCPAALVTHI